MNKYFMTLDGGCKSFADDQKKKRWYRLRRARLGDRSVMRTAKWERAGTVPL